MDKLTRIKNHVDDIWWYWKYLGAVFVLGLVTIAWLGYCVTHTW